jgi:hypothetical protein
MINKKELDRLIDDGDPAVILEAVRDPDRVNRLQRRIVARLYSMEPEIKWTAVMALGVMTGEEGLSLKKIKLLVQRFVWAMSDESGAVPYGIPEALGEILAVRPELQPEYLPLLVSYLVEEDLVQTGPILAGAIWALGRVGSASQEEALRALPGLAAAIEGDESDVRGAALWTAGRLSLGGALRDRIEPLAAIGGECVVLLVDGRVLTLSLSGLARQALPEGN